MSLADNRGEKEEETTATATATATAAAKATATACARITSEWISFFVKSLSTYSNRSRLRVTPAKSNPRAQTP